MPKTLPFFTKEVVSEWFDDCKKVDGIIQTIVRESLETFSHNDNRVTPELAQELTLLLEKHGIDHNFDMSNLEAHNGYTVYNFPDDCRIQKQCNNPDLYYGLAKTDSFGIAHTHRMSDAFNFILEGEGVFAGKQEDVGTFGYSYHGQPMVAGSAYEIPIGMTHGHLVKKGCEVWFLFVQECGFTKNLRCAGDFYTIDEYPKEQFGPYYI